MGGMVERDVLRVMVEGYMDEGKEWSVKAEIQRKLFLILGISQQEAEPKKSGWFGFF